MLDDVYLRATVTLRGAGVAGGSSQSLLTAVSVRALDEADRVELRCGRFMAEPDRVGRSLDGQNLREACSPVSAGGQATATEQDAPGPLLLTHEASYHPDGGQIFFPRGGHACVALRAPPGDDVRPERLRALRVPGDRGLHIDPGVWHQGVYPLAEEAERDDAQGRVHACVSVDLVGESGVYPGLRLI